MVKGWLSSAMTWDMQNSVRYAETTREVWEDLQERYGKGNAQRAYELRRAITLLQQEKQGVTTYFTRMKSL